MQKKEHELVPLMFQAQVEGRSQIQRLIPKQNRQQAHDWVEQWGNSCAIDCVPQFDKSVQTRSYQFSWRMVTNSGQDQGVTRPVIGAKGWAFFPGSSMKGAFLRACRRLRSSGEVLAFCGGVGPDGELHPGCLRFHGGYPEDTEWLDESLVDIVHPQENWQLKGERKIVGEANNSAFIQVSLYKPKFKFGISSMEPLTEEQWDIVWEVWRSAVEQGLGSRVSAGYGQVANHGANRLIGFSLAGQGMASRQIDKKADGEFRPNLFKATLRGHTRRLLSGIVDSKTADRVTKELWGGIGKGESATVGLLGMAFNAPELVVDWWTSEINRNNSAPVYEMEDAMLEILLMRSGLTEVQQKELKSFVQRLMQFSMLLGGFGKSWRRADHRLFMPRYKDQMIGCHWSFGKRSHPLYVLPKDDLSGITKFIDDFVQQGRGLSLLGNAAKPEAGMREAWKKGNVQVWGRIAEDETDCKAIAWLHGNYASGRRIKESELTGKMGKIGRLWHRMYPWYEMNKTADGKKSWKGTGEFVELLTVFPNVEGAEQQKIVQDFLKFLDKETDFVQLW
jgi:CRISPR-associated protein Cmr6